MKIFKKIVLSLFILIFLSIATLCGGIFYLYHHPSYIKALAEKSLPQTFGVSGSIEALSYSLKPLNLRAEGIILKPRDETGDFHLKIPTLQADMTLQGPFGKKTLILNRIKLEGLSLEIVQKPDLPEGLLKKKKDAVLNPILKSAVALLLFKDVRLETTEFTKGNVTALLGEVRIKIRGIQASLNADRLLEIACSAHMEWPSKKASLEAPDLRVTTSQALSLVDPEIKGRLFSKGMRLKAPEAEVKGMDAEASVSYVHKRREIGLRFLDLSLEGLLVRYGSGRLSMPSGLDVHAEGLLSLRDNRITLPKFRVTMGRILEVKGDLRGGAGPQTGLDIRIHEGRLVPEKLVTLLPEGLKEKIPPVSLTGGVTLQGKISVSKGKKAWHLRSDLETRLSRNTLSYRSGDYHLKGTLSGMVRTHGPFPNLHMAATMTGEDILLSGSDIMLKPFQAGFSLSGHYPLFLFKDLNVRVPSANMMIGQKAFSIDDVRLDIPEGSLHVKERNLVFDRILLDSSLLKNLLLSFKAQDDRYEVTARGEQVRLIESAETFDLLPMGWQFSGRDSLQLTATKKGKEPWGVSSRLAFQGLNLQNPDGTLMGEKIALRADLKGDLDFGKQTIKAETFLEINDGEILLGRFYFDLKKNAFTSLGDVQLEFSKKILTLSGLRLDLKEVLRLQMEGQAHYAGRAPDVRLSLNLPRTPLKPLYDTFLLEPFQTEKPLLARFQPAGFLSADLEIEGTVHDWSLEGRTGWHEGNLSLKDTTLDLQGIDMDLPLLIHSRRKGPGERSIKGMVTVEEMNVSPLLDQPLQLPLEARSNRLSIPSHTLLKIPGGTLRVGPVECMDILAPERSIKTSLEINISEPDTLFTGTLPFPVKGTIEGSLDPVRFQKDILLSQGMIKADLFGGEIILSDIQAQGLLTPAPVYGLSARWHDLNLADLTTNTSFGKVRGILKGHIRGLEMAYGQPQKFELLLETVKKKGTPQKISVKAVDNIAQIGGGQSPFLGMAGIMSSFFKEFSYKKIGVHASLANDIFRVNGTIREGQKEYLIKRGGFSGVDVVNQNPDNRIRFKDMVKRIKRITSTKGRPVVK